MNNEPWGKPPLFKRLFNKTEDTLEQGEIEVAYGQQMELLQRSERIQNEDYLQLLMIVANSHKPFRYTYGNKWGEYNDIGPTKLNPNEIHIPPRNFAKAAETLERHIENGAPIITLDGATEFLSCSQAIAAEFVASSETPNPTFNEYLVGLFTPPEQE